MDRKYFKSDSKFLLEKCSRRCDGDGDGGVVRINELPDEIGIDRTTELPEEIVVGILSFMSLREAVTTSVLSSRWSDLWKHTPNLKYDRISQLPDKIIIFILSFLSLREAVATSVLSSRWSELWKHTPSLNFNTNRVERCKYIQMVNSVIQSHKAPSLKEFKITLDVDKLLQCTATKWFEFVFSRQVERLRLDFLCLLPKYVVDLEEILRDSNVFRPETLIFFKSLKRLSLRCFRVSGEAIDLFLRNCPLLEQLFIHDSVLTSDVVVCGTGLVLKQLDIYQCTGGNSIKVSAPNLTRLRVDKTSKSLLLENMPKLIRADYTFMSLKPEDVMHFASGVFGCVSRLEFLNLFLFHPKVFLANGVPRMPRLKKLDISYSGVYGHGLLPLTALIWASPRLQEFKLQFDKIMRDSTTWKEDTVKARRHRHRHLKVFTFLGFSSGARDHIELIEYILDNCVALEKIIIGPSQIYGFVDMNLDFDPQGVTNGIRQQLHGKVPDHIQLLVV